MNDAVDWGAVRALFDSVCELPEPLWESELHALTGDPALVQETLALLRAQTQALGGMQGSIDKVLASLDADDIQVGQLIGPWRLVRLLAAGGMGRVFLAERADQLYRRQVAIKVMRRSLDPALAERLQAESQILADLQHPNIAHLYDVGRAGADQPYLVMEFIDGQRLDEACRSPDITLTGVLGLFCKVCRAVQAAHAQGVIHCDIKPANVLVRSDDEPVLLDFGISRLMSDGSSEVGAYATPRYTSPERRSGRPAAVADDIYSLGVMLDELLALGGPAVRLDGDLMAVAARARAGRRRSLRIGGCAGRRRDPFPAASPGACAAPQPRAARTAVPAPAMARLRRGSLCAADGGGLRAAHRRCPRPRRRERGGRLRHRRSAGGRVRFGGAGLPR